MALLEQQTEVNHIVDEATGYMATISACEKYRYGLYRPLWRVDPDGFAGVPQPQNGVCTFVMLNPSTADAFQDDPTIRRCMGYAKAWGFQGLNVMNLYAYRATDPKKLLEVDDPVGPDNDYAFQETIWGNNRIVAAWGAWPGPQIERPAVVTKMLVEKKAEWATLVALAYSKHGHPRHPLYLKKDLTPFAFPPGKRVGSVE